MYEVMFGDNEMSRSLDGMEMFTLSLACGQGFWPWLMQHGAIE